MKRILSGIVWGVLLANIVAQADSDRISVSAKEEQQWVRWVIPLPKEISIPAKAAIPVSDVRITLRKDAGEVEKTAFNQLISLFEDKGNTDCSKGSFEILISVSDKEGKVDGTTIPGVKGLEKLPNWEQAYYICPVGDDRLVLTALDERGVYYAVQTLRQLLESKFDNGVVSMPLVSVTDWPDMAERGEWNVRISGCKDPVKADRTIEWMAGHKMNLFEPNTRFKVTKGEGDSLKVNAWIQAGSDMFKFSRHHAFKIVPSIAHIDIWLDKSGIYEIYPELLAINQKTAGVNEKTMGKATEYALCPSQQDLLIKTLSKFMYALARIDGVTDINCWLTESGYENCKCAKCVKDGKSLHWILEARAVVKAWQIVRRQYPDLNIRVLLTNGSYRDNEQILSELPPEVHASYYHCSRTYNSWKEPMIYPVLEKYAAKGGWLGVYPQNTGIVRIISPWSAPQFIKYRMNEFVRKELKNVSVYCAPDHSYHDFNITAVAEWLWNSRGRSEYEFAAAWATRRGFEDPDAVAQWADLLGPVGWDVYGADVVEPYFNRSHKKWIGNMVINRRSPELGKGMFKYFPTEEHIEHDLAACEKALTIADSIGSPEIIQETKVIQGYVRMLKEIYSIANQVSMLKNPTYEQRLDLQKAMTRLASAGLQARNELRNWQDLMVERHNTKHLSRRGNATVRYIDETVSGFADILESSFGIPDSVGPYFRIKIGQWVKEDFGDLEEFKRKIHSKIIKKWEITQYLARTTPSQMKVLFSGTGGGGLEIYRVALASSPKDIPNQLTELSVDEHEEIAYYPWSTKTGYMLNLEKYDPDSRYFIVADAKGQCYKDDCAGSAYLRMPVPTGSTLSDIADKFRPVPDKEFQELAQARVLARTVKFKGKGLRVGVVKDSYGGTSILNQLRAIKKIDAQALPWPLDNSVINACQVIVLPQPQYITGPLVAKELEKFVYGGGGLITTHDAVGYRKQPLLITDICARGVRHIIPDKQWMIVKEHPVTKGIDLNTPLFHIYYDHIEVECGPRGTILAKAPQTGEPVVVAGVYGKGRYVACGLLIGSVGIITQDDAPAGAEKILLENAVKWCGEQP